jgi:GntR family transcriptional regulator / MocR family aminotransferase
MKVSSEITPVIAIDRKAETPIYRQVYQAFRSAVMEGRLRAGERVPSTRTLAVELGVSRIPVLDAYAQLLAEGYFESRTGSGTVISRSLPNPIAKAHAGNGDLTKPRLGARNLSTGRSSQSVRSVLVRRSWGPFNVGQTALDQFPFRIWNSLVSRQCRRATTTSFDYGDPLGLEDLRQTIAAYVRTARSVRCEPDQIMVVSGAQQALEITARVLLDPSSTVWMEEPGYSFARRVFQFRGCRLVPVRVDSEGLDVAEGIKRCATARAAMVSPSHQYPLGATMSASRRLQLIEWAERMGSWIIEDDYDSEFRYETMPIASLQGLDWNARVVYIGTFSKVLFPSLRLGYIVIPRDLVEQFIDVRLAIDLTPPSFFQHVLAEFIREGHFSRHIRRMRALYGERRAALIDSLRHELGPDLRISGEQAGTHLTLFLKGTTDLAIVERAAKKNLWLVPLSTSYFGKAVQQGLVLGFGSTAAEEISPAVRKLRSLLNTK